MRASQYRYKSINTYITDIIRNINSTIFVCIYDAYIFMLSLA